MGWELHNCDYGSLKASVITRKVQDTTHSASVPLAVMLQCLRGWKQIHRRGK